MIAYVARRLLVALAILLAATFLMFVLVSLSGDPLAELATDRSPNKEQKIQARIDQFNLDEPLVVRYLIWGGGAVGCLVPGAACDLGQNSDGQDVAALLSSAMGSTLRLVVLATVLSIILGVTVGILSALRQYSRFDYSVTFLAFLFFSLPIFWVAVLLKQFGAIELNTWLADPTFSIPVTIVLSLLSAWLFGTLIGGGRRDRFLKAAGIAFAGTAAILGYWSVTQWWANPSLGPLLVGVLSAAVTVGAISLATGLDDRRVVITGLATVVAGVAVALAGRPILLNPTLFGLLLLGGIVVAFGLVMGLLIGGIDRPAAMRIGVVAALATGFFVWVDWTLANFASYSAKVGGRPVATIGAVTPNFSGNFWQSLLDSLMHLALPTLAIMLISFATYSRYTRASMLETLQSDYVRTARAKGLSERTVVVRHAFRNALIPITTLAALDFGAIIGGAVITETVFGWKGMGELFQQGLANLDINQVMGFFIVVAISVLIFNLLADLSYAWLDPRIRLG